MTRAESPGINNSVGRAKRRQFGREPLGTTPATRGRARPQRDLAQLTGFRIAYAVVAGRVGAAALAVTQYVDDLDLVPRAQKGAQRLFVFDGGDQKVGD